MANPPRHRRRSALAAPAAIVLCLLAIILASCGGSNANDIASKSPEQILASARQAALRASSVHIVNNAAQGRLRFASDQELDQSGGRARVKLAGLSFEVTRTGNTLYLTGNPAFARRLEHTIGIHLTPGTWLKAAANNPQLAQLAYLTELDKQLTVQLTVPRPLAKGPASTLDGQPAITLNHKAKLYNGTLYIATTGNPYPIKQTKQGRETGQTTYTNWNQPITIAAPANTIPLPG